MTEVSIRPVKLQDVPRVLEMRRTYLPVKGPEGEPEPSFETEHMSHLVLNHRSANSVLLLATVDGVTAGYTHCRPFLLGDRRVDFSSAFAVNHLVVEPSYRRMGVGEALIGRASASILSRGYGFLMANIGPDSEPFYSATGWNVSESSGGLAWVDPPKEEGKLLLPPDDPMRAFQRVSSLMMQPPHESAGFDRMAFKLLRSDWELPVWFFKSFESEDESRRNAIQGLVSLATKTHSPQKLPLTALLQFSYELRQKVGTEAFIQMVDECREESAFGHPTLREEMGWVHRQRSALVQMRFPSNTSTAPILKRRVA